MTADTVGPATDGVRGFEGKGRVSGALAPVRELLAIPLFAVCTGLALGVVLIAPLFWTLRLLDSKNADAALYVVMGSVFGGLLVGLAVMVGYWFASRDGFTYFGPATVVGFVLALGVLAVRTGMRMMMGNDESKG